MDVPEEEKKPTAQRVLVIDDDIISQNMVRSALTKAGYSVIVASDGDEGIKKAVEQMPGLIILDIMMPGMDGVDVASLLNSNPRTERIPIIFLSSLITKKGERTNSGHDAPACLAKPFDGDELLNEVKKYFQEPN